MARAGVTIAEVDLSTRVPAFPGVYGGILIPAKKGLVGKPTLVTSESQFLKRYTPDEKVEVGYDNAHFSALSYLQKSNKLWVIRVANTSLFAGVTFKESTASSDNAGWASGEADPTAYTFDNTSGDSDALLFAAKNEGAWGNAIRLKLTNYATDPDLVKEEGAFLLQVYKSDNLNDPVETFTLSRTLGAKDGYGRTIYVEDVLDAETGQSEYISCVDNTAVADYVTPKDDLDGLYLASGDDGGAVTDGNMMTALLELQNPENNALTLMLDGGWATAAYQKTGIIALCEARKDCVGLLSTPYASEASANYLADLNTYRSTTLNANSSFAGLYTPHVRIYDRFNDRNVYVPPDGYVGAAITETASNQEIWFPPAGFRRGMLNVLDLRRRFTTGEMDSLYDNGLNPNRFAPGRGILIWGQKTLLSRPSSLDRMNVRLLLIVIEPAIGFALEDFVFEINDEVTRAIITAIITSYMENIKARRGVYDFQVICNEENNSAEDIDNNRLNVWLFVKPVKAAEFIKFTTVITRTGMDFALAAQAL